VFFSLESLAKGIVRAWRICPECNLEDESVPKVLTLSF
jgi:hypothetical protein